MGRTGDRGWAPRAMSGAVAFGQDNNRSLAFIKMLPGGPQQQVSTNAGFAMGTVELRDNSWN